MEEIKNTKEISLKDLGLIFLKRIWIILLVTVVAVLGAFGIIKLTYKPAYKSVSSMYVLSSGDEENGGSSTNDFMLAFHLVNDCEYMIKSHKVLDEVIEELSLDIPFSTLADSISVDNPKDTRIIEVSVCNAVSEDAKKIVDVVLDKSITEINRTMGKNQVNPLEKGAEPYVYNAPKISTYILVGIIAMILTYIVFILIDILDDKLKTDEDIEKYLELSVLGNIPNVDDLKKIKKGYRRYGNGYAKYYGTSNTDDIMQNSSEDESK